MRSGIALSFLIPAHLGYSLLLVTSYRVSRCFSYPLVPSDRSIKQDSLLPSFDSAGSIAADSWNGDSLFRFPRTFLFSFLSCVRTVLSLLEVSFEYIARDTSTRSPTFRFSKNLIFRFAFYPLFAMKSVHRWTSPRITVWQKCSPWVFQFRNFWHFSFFFFLYEAKSKRDRNNGKRYIHFSRKNTLSLRSRWTSFRLEWNTCRNTPCEIIRGFHPGTTRRGAKLSSTSRLTRALFVFTEVELQ